MAKLDRFQPPRAEDEYRECQGCGRLVHYLRLDGFGLCEKCGEDEKDWKLRNENESD